MNVLYKRSVSVVSTWRLVSELGAGVKQCVSSPGSHHGASYTECSTPAHATVMRSSRLKLYYIHYTSYILYCQLF